MNRTILICLFLLLTGCATTNNFNAALSTWIEIDRDDLFRSWGPPDVRAELKDGGEIIEYRWQNRWRKQENPGQKGLAYALGYKFGEWLAGGSKPLGCTIRFHISPKGAITEYQFAGKECRASNERKEQLSYTRK